MASHLLSGIGGYRVPPKVDLQIFRQALGENLVGTRILIVDDSPLVRQRLRDLLQQHPDWEVCGEAANGQDAITRARELSPDVIVLDFLMPGMNGMQAAREIGKVIPDVPILMFTTYLSQQLVEEARNVGIRGAVAKSDARYVIDGLEALLRNESFFYSTPN
jgi:DNA-binding NarL/FixJ family response regulator